MYDYTIDKDVPFVWTFSRNWQKYPFPDMQVWDSFFVPCNKQNSRTSAWASQYGKIYNQKYSVRSIKENGILIGYRCWRLQ